MANVDEMPEEVWLFRDLLEGRSMLVRKVQVVPFKAIVRGYITGAHFRDGDGAFAFYETGPLIGALNHTGIAKDGDRYGRLANSACAKNDNRIRFRLQERFYDVMDVCLPSDAQL